MHKTQFHSSFKGTLPGLRQILAAENLLKVMKIAFYFTSEALFVFKIFKFFSWLFGHVAKRLDKKDKVNFKLYDVTAWLTKIVIEILPRTSRSKGNQTMKFGELIECNMRNIFLERLYTKYGGESQTLFWKIKIEYISGSIV